jgi:hypothetical protein
MVLERKIRDLCRIEAEVFVARVSVRTRGGPAITGDDPGCGYLVSVIDDEVGSAIPSVLARRVEVRPFL